MRLWSLHPQQLDRMALVAGWCEGLLAQKVLQGLTKGYQHHPQLERFRAADEPVRAVGAWLCGLADEADERGYRFDRSRVVEPGDLPGLLSVTDGQLAFEAEHLQRKVTQRSPEWLPRVDGAHPHPLFRVVAGPVEPWERLAPYPPTALR